MHPEVIKDVQGTVISAKWRLVRAESLRYVSPETDQQEPPLVIPYAAVLPTGTRAVVYVELPAIHSAAGQAFRTTRGSRSRGHTGSRFARPSQRMSECSIGPTTWPGTDYARQLWNGFANRLAQLALAGQREASSLAEAQQAFGRIEAVMMEAREKFALRVSQRLRAARLCWDCASRRFLPGAARARGRRDGRAAEQLQNRLGSSNPGQAQHDDAGRWRWWDARARRRRGRRPSGAEHAGQQMTLPGEFQRHVSLSTAL